MTAAPHTANGQRGRTTAPATAQERQRGRTDGSGTAEEEHREQTVAERLGERPGLDLGKARQARPRDLLVRFGAGALTSVVSGVVTLVFGSPVGGILLAFPAILAASLTLIEEQEDGEESREDARGAIAGAGALIAFAVVAALAFGHLPGAAALGLASLGWVAVAAALYAAFWWR